MTLRILLLLFVLNQSYAQTITENELKTTIKNVTVFIQGAQITRTGKVNIPLGKSILSVKSLSPHLDAKSIIVKADGDFTVLSVNHKFNYLNQLDADHQLEQLNSVIKSLQNQIDNNQVRLAILSEKQSVLSANKMLGSESSGIDLSELKQTIEFFDKELTTIKAEEIKIKVKINDLKKDILKHERQIGDLSSQNNLPSGEIEIAVEAKSTAQGNFTISYLTANAGWYPSYDIRVKNIESPITLNYKADVHQNTGVDWENVKLKFSNADPNQSGMAPELSTWHLNLARLTNFQAALYGSRSPQSISNVTGKVISADDGAPLPGVNVIVKGTTIGTVTDTEGNYDLLLPNNAYVLVFSFVGMITQELPVNRSRIDVTMQADLMQLDEVVVAAYGVQRKGLRIRGASSIKDKREAKPIITTTIENQTTVEFEVKNPYSLKSHGKTLTIELKEYNIDAFYQYYAVPKIDKDAFLIASIVNWDQYNLLEGEANLYFEDSYVGRTILDARSLADTLNISLGRDKSLVVGREKVADFTKRKTIGSNKIDSRGFKIIARNKKSQSVKLTIYDQLPIAAISSIIVNPGKLSGGKLDKDTGEVAWELLLSPQQQEEFLFQYEVKYPKREKVYLE